MVNYLTKVWIPFTALKPSWWHQPLRLLQGFWCALSLWCICQLWHPWKKQCGASIQASTCFNPSSGNSWIFVLPGDLSANSDKNAILCQAWPSYFETSLCARTTPPLRTKHAPGKTCIALFKSIPHWSPDLALHLDSAVDSQPKRCIVDHPERPHFSFLGPPKKQLRWPPFFLCICHCDFLS